MTASLAAVRRVPRASWRGGKISSGERAIPEETAVALTYNRFAYAVMMATPHDLEDFAIGFSLSERVIARPDEILDIEIVPGDNGVELRLWIAEGRIDAFTEHRRYMAGPTGCGLCGVESLAEAMRPPPKVTSGFCMAADAVADAVAALPALQSLNRETRAIHAAAFWTPESEIVALREDVGRHNALDKLVGALARGHVTADFGAILLTSRVSVEMIQKAAVCGAPIVVAVSAPTALALRTAEDAGITLVAIARDDGFEAFSHRSASPLSQPSMLPEKLIYMANQIGKFFAHGSEEQAVFNTADHLKKFWDPRMRKAIVDYVEVGGEGLQPIVLKAVRSLSPESSPTAKIVS